MFDWMLTRTRDREMLKTSGATLRYLVLDEIHTYRGNKATHLKYLLARLKALVNGPLVQIATSATLQSAKTVDDEKLLEKFFINLLDVRDYQLIQPEFEAETEIEPHPMITPPLSYLTTSERTLEDNPHICIELLTGQTYSDDDWMSVKSSSSKPYQDLKRHPFIKQLQDVLINSGPKSFLELKQLMKKLLPSEYQKQPRE